MEIKIEDDRVDCMDVESNVAQLDRVDQLSRRVGPSRLCDPFFDRLRYAKTEGAGEGLVHFIT